MFKIREVCYFIQQCASQRVRKEVSETPNIMWIKRYVLCEHFRLSHKTDIGSLTMKTAQMIPHYFTTLHSFPLFSQFFSRDSWQQKSHAVRLTQRELKQLVHPKKICFLTFMD